MDDLSRQRGYARNSREELRLFRELEREAELGAAGGARPCVHVHHHHHHHHTPVLPLSNGRYRSPSPHPQIRRSSPSLDLERGGAYNGVSHLPRQPRAIRRDSSSSLDSTFRNPRQASRNPPPGRRPSSSSARSSHPPSPNHLGLPSFERTVDDPELGDLVVRSCVREDPNYLPLFRRAPEDILSEATHVFEEDPVTLGDPATPDIESLVSDSGESFRSDSSRLPEQVNSAREDLSLLIRTEIYSIIADGYQNNRDIYDELVRQFLDESCENLQEFRALFHFAFRCPIEEGFLCVCEEVRR